MTATLQVCTLDGILGPQPKAKLEQGPVATGSLPEISLDFPSY